MRYLRQLAVFNVILLGLSSLGFAEWSSRNRVELGMTDNAKLTSTDKQSDVFLDVGTSNSLALAEQSLGLRLGYRDYSKDNSDDVLSWGLSDRLKCLADKTFCQVEFKGQEYVYGEPGNTDTSFSNYGLNLSLEKTRDLRNGMSLNMTGGYALKDYYSQSRLDNTIYFRPSLGYNLNPLWYLEGSGELGLVKSSLDEYSAVYFEMIGLAEYYLDKDWSFVGEFGVKQTSFTSRDLTTQTVVTRRSGKTVSQTDTSKEAYTLIYLSGEANRKFSGNSSAGFVLRSNQQSSRSGYEDYSEVQILARVLITY